MVHHHQHLNQQATHRVLVVELNQLSLLLIPTEMVLLANLNSVTSSVKILVVVVVVHSNHHHTALKLIKHQNNLSNIAYPILNHCIKGLLTLFLFCSSYSIGVLILIYLFIFV
jgi:hypothetical protein